MKTSTLAIVLITWLCLTLNINAQQDQFVIGAYMHSTPWGHTGPPSFHPQDSSLFSLWRAKSLGINTAMVYVRDSLPDPDIFYEGIYPGPKQTNMEALRDFPNVIAMNTTSAHRLLNGIQPNPPNKAIRNFDYIYFYSGAYYSKWDATKSSIPIGVLGLKHDENFGSKISLPNGKEYWSSDTGHSEGLLVKGPNYNQETVYRSSGYPTMWDNEVQTYEINFNMILKNTPLPSQLNDTMCEIMVYTKYTTDNFVTTDYDTLAIKTLTVGEIGDAGEQTLTYDFSTYCKNAFKSRIEQTEEGLCPTGTKQLIDVEFRVKYLNPNHELLIDYIEVYDQNIWKRWLSDLEKQTLARNNIANYLQKFKQENSQFYSNNLKYFFGVDEPHTVDAYIPHAFVQSVLDSLNNVWPEGAPQLFTHLYPEWNGFRNDARVIPPFVETVKPKPFHFYYQPTIYNISTAYGLDNFRNIFFWVYEAIEDEDFWVSINVYDIPNHWLHWRGPSPAEINASVMIALSHGAKGIFYEPFYSYNINTGGLLKWNPNDNPPYTPTPTGEQVRDYINPRLSGIIGNTLLKLKYSGNEICLRQAIDRECWYSGSSDEYLTLYSDPILGSSNKYDFNATFLFDPNDNDNKYFMATNSLALESKVLNAELNLSSSSYENIRLRNVEGGLDVTFKDFYNLNYNFPAGEGYLFQVAPVVKYGGKLVYNETVNNNPTLYDEMSIESGATLTINGTYTANADITVKSGGKIKYGNSNSKIVFNNGAKLILEGNAQVLGLSISSRLILEYNSSTSVGVVINPNASPIISYCNITGPINGITVENEATINVSNVNISNCSNAGIALFHFGNGDSYSTLNTPTIYKCNITNCGTGISVVNCSEVVIKENSINQCNLGLYFNMVNSAYISKNTILGIQSNVGSPMPGISMSSSGGYLRNNIIRYHNFGVLLAYSSPDLGVNSIEYNYKCGVYSDVGSFPNLVQQLANPNCWYPIGGCNVIKNNGTFTQLPPSAPQTLPDGAEIFLNSGDVLLSYGFNEISDDRAGIPTYLTIPLIKGTRSREGSREFFVDHNYWGVVGPSPSRFGTLEADYDPTADYCPLPDAPCSGSELIIQTTDGQIIDTLDSRERESTEIGALEENYAYADKLFYSGDIEGSKTYYLVIVQSNYTNEEKLYAYNKLYEIGEILREPKSYYTELQNAFNSIIQTETDTLLLKAFNQRSILCDVSKEEYLTAINKFDNIIQQNPNSEEAVYAEIDIITTALNIDTTNSGLGKIGGGKYLVKGTSDYLSKLNDILQSKFGINSEEKVQIIPKEYSLHQNYPNPFNPSTVISWQSPVSSHQTIKIYDILGKEVATLVDEFREAGVYEITFDASNLASGVYVYKLQAGDFVSSKKMILLK